MPRILFLHGDISAAHNDNHERLPAGFSNAGWHVDCLDHDSVRIVANQLRFGVADPAAFDLIWLLGFGRQISFFDRLQLLKALPARQMVISVDGLMYLHGKHRWLQHMPETYTSSDREFLLEQLQRGGRWVLKPTAGSYGRDVLVIDADRDGATTAESVLQRSPQSFFMLQRFIDQIAEGEVRTLVAGGEIIASYRRLPGADSRANVSLGAAVAQASLTSQETELVSVIACELAQLGVGFAAVDTVYPYLMEVNVANPGGLGTLAALGSEAATARSVEAVCRWRGFRSS